MLKVNALAFFQDDGKISLSRLSSIIANSPNRYNNKATGNAFQFQKIGKDSINKFKPGFVEVINISLFY